MNREGIIKSAAAALGGVTFWANCLFAYAPESNFWTDRRKQAERNRAAGATLVASLPGSAPTATGREIFPDFPAIGPSLIGRQLSDPVKEGLPPDFLKTNNRLFSVLSRAPGTVRKISLPTGYSPRGPIVVHIQDIHRNEEAQRNIGATVGGLLAEGKATVLALEGASGDISLQPFRDYQNRPAVRQAADYLLKENKISGPIHAVLIGTGPRCPVIGIDDPVHYRANVEAYRQTVPLQSDIQRDLNRRARSLEQEKKYAFSSRLLEFDGQVEAYRARQLSLGDFVQILLARHKGEPCSAVLRCYSEAVGMERALDFHQVERDRRALIEQLSRKISPAQEKDLLAATLAYRAGQIRPSDFYARINRLCEQNGILLAHFPAMGDYLRYIFLADKIQPESLYRDVLSLERDTYQKLVQTPDEKRLVALSRKLYLTEKLAEFSLTPQEWEEYAAGLLERTAEGEKLKPFESFYQEAKIRDQSMGDHLLRAMGQPSGQVAVLVTGGFHADGLTEKLTRAGVVVVSFVPKIEKLETDRGSVYLSVFTQEKTPLDELFQGEKLFLAYPPAPSGVLHALLPLLVVGGFLYSVGLSFNVDPQVLYQSLGGVGLLGAVKIVGDRVLLRLSREDKDVSLSMEMGSLGITKVVEAGGKMASAARLFRDGWVQTKNILKNQFSIEDRINPAQIRKELVYVLPILAALAYDALISPVAPWALLACGSASLVWFLRGHREMFLALQESIPDSQKKFTPWVYFPFVALGFVTFSGLGSGAFAFAIYLSHLGSGIPLAAELAGAVLAFLVAVEVSHPITNVKLAVPATMERAERPVNGAILQQWYEKFVKAYRPLALPHNNDVNFEKQFKLIAIQIKDLLKLDATMANIFTTQEAQDDLFHFIEALQTYLLLPNNLAIGDFTLFDRLLLVDRNNSLRLTYMGRPITIYAVTNVGKKTKIPIVMPSNTGSLVGRVYVNVSDAAEEAKTETDKALDREDIEYAILDWNTRVALARVKQLIGASLKEDLKTYESHGDPILKSVIKPESSLWQKLPPQVEINTDIADEQDHAAYIARVKSENDLQLFAQFLEGTQEHLSHLKDCFPDEKKSHALGFLAIKRLWSQANSAGNASVAKAAIQIFELLHLIPSDKKNIADAFFSPEGHLNTMEKLTSAMNKIYSDHFIPPEDRFFQIFSRNPSTEELDELYGRMNVVLRRPRAAPSKIRVPVHPRSSASNLLRNLLARERTSSVNVDYENERNRLFLEQAAKIWDASSRDSGTMEGFTRLLAGLAGHGKKNGGLRGASQKIKGDPAVRTISTLLEDLLMSSAREVFHTTLIGALGQVNSGNHTAAIGELLKIKENEDFLDSLGVEKALELDDHLATFRAILSMQDPSKYSGISPLGNPELFGLDPQEVAFLRELSKKEPNVSELGFCKEAVSLLRAKLGRFAPGNLEQYENLSKPRDAVPEENVTRLLGIKVYLSEELQKTSGRRLLENHSHEILMKMTQVLEACDSELERFNSGKKEEGQRHRINPMASGHSLKGNLRGIQRDYIQNRTLRVYFRIFPDGHIFIIDLVNKGDTSDAGSMSDGIVRKLERFAKASSPYNPIFAQFKPLLRKNNPSADPSGKQAGVPASLADRYAIDLWGLGSPEYRMYTKYVAPAWEWIYFVPGLNLLGQWGLSDWIVRRHFGKNDGRSVVEHVPYQAALTAAAVLALGMGMAVGSPGGILIGAVVSSVMMAHIFSEAHSDRTASERRGLFLAGLGMALVLMAPSFVLFVWDPSWLAGMGAVIGYFAAFVLGVGANYFVHAQVQNDGVTSIPRTDPEIKVTVDDGRMWAKRIMAIDRFFSIGDSERALSAWRSLSPLLQGLPPHSFLGRLLELFDQAIRNTEDFHPTDNSRAVALLLEEMEESLFVSRNLGDFFRTMDLLNREYGRSLSNAQKETMTWWNEIRTVMDYFVAGEWDKADREAEYLGTSGRVWLEDGGISHPYRERLIFGFLRDYWAQRNFRHSSGDRAGGIHSLIERMANPSIGADDPNAIANQMRSVLSQSPTDFEGGAINILAERVETVHQGSYLPRFVVPQERPGLSRYEPILIRAMRMFGSHNVQPVDFIRAVEDYLAGKNRHGVLQQFLTIGKPFPNTQVFLMILDAALGKSLVPGNFGGMHAVGGKMTEKDRLVFRAVGGQTSTPEMRRQWAADIEIALKHPVRGRDMERFRLVPLLNRLMDMLRMDHPAIQTVHGTVPVSFRLLPGSWTDSMPGRPRAYWEYALVETSGTAGLAITVYLYADDLAAVIHEGVEVMFEENSPNRPSGNAHTYAFLAEVLANPRAGDNLVPDRARAELGYKSQAEVRSFLVNSGESFNQIIEKFPWAISPLINDRLMQIRYRLINDAVEMYQERSEDPMKGFLLQVQTTERTIALGLTVQARQEFKVLTRRYYHLKQKEGSLPFFEDVVNHLRDRVAQLEDEEKKLGALDQTKSNHIGEFLEKMEQMFLDMDFYGLSMALNRMDILWGEGTLFPEQKEAMALWRDIGACLGPIMDRADWEESDKKVDLMERNWLTKLSKKGVGHMYLECVLFDFLGAYRQQRELTYRAAHKTKLISQVLQSLLGGAGRRTPVELIEGVHSNPNDFEKAALVRALLLFNSGRGTPNNLYQLFSPKGSEKTWNPHVPGLVQVMENFPRDKITVWGLSQELVSLTNPTEGRGDGSHYLRGLNLYGSFVPEVGTADISDIISQISRQGGFHLIHVSLAMAGVTVLALVAGVLMANPTAVSGLLYPLLFVSVGAVVAIAVYGMFRRAQGAARNFARAIKQAQEEVPTENPLSLDVSGRDLVKATAVPKGLWFEWVLKKALAQYRIAPMSFSSARLLIAEKLGGAPAMDLAAAGTPEAGGGRPLTIVYLDGSMVREGKIGPLAQRYSSTEAGALVLVPTDDAARTAAAAFRGIRVEARGGLFGEGALRVPGLAEVEQRLAKAGVDFRQYTGCRVVTPLGMAIDVEGVKSALFRQAIIVLLNGLTGILIRREDLRSIDRAARAVGSAA